MIDGAKALALTALDLMSDGETLANVRGDFAASAELSKLALEISRKSSGHGHAHAGCA